jgi:predicted transcriptional regulator
MRHGDTVRPNGLSAPSDRSLDFNLIRIYSGHMTKLLDDALKAASRLSPREQDEIARVIMQLAGEDMLPPVALSQEENDAIARSRAAAARGEFATDEQVRAVWSRHGL